MRPKSQVEWAVIVSALCCIFITLVYSGWRIQVTSAWLKEHRDYIKARDLKWEPVIDRIEDHLTQQDKAIYAYTPDVHKILENQKVIIDHIKREEAAWSKAGIRP